MISLSNKNISNIKLGNKTVSKITLGPNVIYQNSRIIKVSLADSSPASIYELVMSPESGGMYSYYSSNPSKHYAVETISSDGSSYTVKVKGDYLHVSGFDTVWVPADEYFNQSYHTEFCQREDSVVGGNFLIQDEVTLHMSIPLRTPRFTLPGTRSWGDLTFTKLYYDYMEYGLYNCPVAKLCTYQYDMVGTELTTLNIDGDISVESPIISEDEPLQDKYGTHYTYEFSGTHEGFFTSLTLPLFGKITNVSQGGTSYSPVYWNSSDPF